MNVEHNIALKIAYQTVNQIIILNPTSEIYLVYQIFIEIHKAGLYYISNLNVEQNIVLKMANQIFNQILILILASETFIVSEISSELLPEQAQYEVSGY